MAVSTSALVFDDLKKLPVVLTLAEVAMIFRVSPLTIRRQLSINEFRPLPFEKYPYRWLRDDVIKSLATHRPKLRMRKHGFAATKAKRRASGE
jgi:hypothetical protein